ncbi:MAG: type IV secretion system DNA-binding domain-containing protein [Candidatus Micrarchaeaceae archaeon]
MTAFKTDKQEVFVKDRFEARDDFENTKLDIMIILGASILLGFFFPSLCIGLLGIAGYRYYRFLSEYFLNQAKYKKYSALLSPSMAYSTYINVGYEIEDRNIDKHLEMLKRLDAKEKTAINYLARMEKRARGLKYPLVGLSKNQLVTHFWLIGTTGAGKTSLIMQLTKLLADQGGGLIFIDGKADTKMVFKMYNILKKAGREQDFLLINFLPKENFREHTNTFNPFAKMNHTEIVEFLMSIIGDTSGDRAYWAGRGKALLQAIVYVLYYRKKYCNENFAVSTINSYLSDLNSFVFLISVLYATLIEEEKKLTSIQGIDNVVKLASQKKSLDVLVPHIDAVSFYFGLYPYEKTKFPDLDVAKYTMLFEAYSVASSYVMQISQSLWETVKEVAIGLMQKTNNFLSLQIGEINALKESDAKMKKTLADLMQKVGQNALQQHSYAQQQWTNIFGSIMAYSNIFGTSEPEIDLVDVIKNNKFLYVLLPALAASNDTTNMLGKLMISAIRKAISTALGEAVEGLTQRQREILTKRITPLPLGLLVLDEYGAYPIAGIDTILAQVRSINISVILSTQDFTSARAEGKDENSVKRAWANTQKIILRIKDNETLKMIEEVMPEKQKVKYQYILEGGYEYTKRDSATVEKEKVFDSKVISAFRNGLSIFMTDDRAVLTQIFWADADESDMIYLNHSVRPN